MSEQSQPDPLPQMPKDGLVDSGDCLAGTISDPEFQEQLRVIAAKNESLERQVRERTLELQEANDRLQREIAERRRLEEALRESEQWKRAIPDAIPDPAWIKDIEGCFLAVNAAWCEFFNVSMSDVLGKTVFDFLRPQAAARSHQEDLEVIRSGQQVRVEENQLTTENGPVWFETIKNVLRNDRGETIGTAGIARNITDRMRIEELLRENETRYRTLVESSLVGVWQITPDGHTVYANPAMMSMLEVSRIEDLADRRFRSFFTQDYLDVVDREIEKRRQGISSSYEVQIVGLHGRRRDVVVSGSPVFAQTGELIGLIGSFTDITDRKRAEESLRKSEGERKAILDGLRNVTVEYLDSDLRILWRNDTNVPAPGRCSVDARGKFCYEVAMKRNEPCPGCTARKALQTGYPQEGEVAMPDGRAMLTCSNPIKDEDGMVVGVIHVAVDITERRQAEEKLEHMQVQLAHVARLSTVGELAAEVAHELSQPLYAILNYAKASRNLLAAGDTPDLATLHESSEKIERIATGASAICKRLRSFSRRAESVRAACDINEIVTESIALVAFEARRAKVLLETELAKGPLVVAANRVEIQQVFVNLLHNAFEAMEGVSDRMRRVTVQTTEVDNFVKIVVSDNGVGLPSGDPRNIFEAFVTTKPEGLGMGLAISTTIVESHGGRLRAISNPDGGASFRCTLPLVQGDCAHDN